LAWSGDDAILVQTGDIVDRGTYAWDIYRLMARLRGEASRVGGRVVSILGNHEVMNAIGDWRYVTQDDIQHTGGSEQRFLDMSTEGWLGKEWLAK
jgi:3',5'-cyclic AMP phosphodiesterase CpdA